MKEMMISLIASFSLVFIVWLICFSVGKNPNEKFVSERITDCENNEKFVSERITACENAGGRYRLYYSDFEDDYVEYCNVAKAEIKNF